MSHQLDPTSLDYELICEQTSLSFPYDSHIFRDSYGSGMGIVWETYHKRVPLLGVPGITLESVQHHHRIFCVGNGPGKPILGIRLPVAVGEIPKQTWASHRGLS